MTETIVADYLIMGAGATGMAFADSVFTETDATMVIVDRRDRPGGHWVDAYPFVRLHQPSSGYGVNSTPLGTGCIDGVGLNAGFHELASGAEVSNHYDVVMRQRFLPSGRVRFLPMSEVGDDREVVSLLSRAHVRVDARRFVDATHSRMQIPSTTPPAYDVDPDVACVPPNALPRVAPGHDEFVVVGAGKTGMDTCIWLLGNGVPPEHITWIVSRDSWVLRRGNVQPGADFFAATCKSIADQAESTARATSVDDLFHRLEACGELRRVEPGVWPEAYHCAILSDGELEQLRRIRRVVRLGRVESIGPDEIRLERGTVPITPGALFVDCSAAGIPTRPSTPVFDGDRITLQWVRTCQPAFSSAFIGFVETRFTDDAVRNRICTPIVPPTVPLDWLRMYRVELANRRTWSEFAELEDWQASARLDLFTPTARQYTGRDVDATAHLGRYLEHLGPAEARLDELLTD